jgi:hypothetical protein
VKPSPPMLAIVTDGFGGAASSLDGIAGQSRNKCIDYGLTAAVAAPSEKIDQMPAPLFGEGDCEALVSCEIIKQTDTRFTSARRYLGAIDSSVATDSWKSLK